MANIQAELAAIMAAVYGEEVRGSIHDAIGKINDVSEVILTTGTSIDSPTSPSAGFYESSFYLNTNTFELWRCAGLNSWVSLGIIKGPKGDTGAKGDTGPKGDTGDKGDTGPKGDTGAKGDPGVDGANGNKWYRGTAVYDKSTTATAFDTGIANANVGDNYINIQESAVYHCSVAGNPSIAKWVYDFTITGSGGGGGGGNIIIDDTISPDYTWSSQKINTEIDAVKVDIIGSSTGDIENSVDGNIRSLHLLGNGRKSKNFFALPNKSANFNGVTTQATSDGIITMKGTPTSNINSALVGSWGGTEPIFTLTAGTYTISGNGDATSTGVVNIVANGTRTLFNPSITSVTLIEDTPITGIFCVYNDTGYIDKTFRIMLNEGSTALPYEPYGLITSEGIVESSNSDNTKTSNINASEILNSSFTGVNDIKDELIVNADGSGKFIKRVEVTETDIVPLSEPIITDLTPSQISALLSLKTFDGYTEITSDCEYEISYYTEFGTPISDLDRKANSITDKLTKYTELGFLADDLLGELVVGALSFDNGAEVSGSGNRVRSGFISISDKILNLYAKVSNVQARVLFYRSDKTFISAQSSWNNVTEDGLAISGITNASYIRIVFRLSTDSTITVDSLGDLILSESISIKATKALVDTKITKPNTASNSQILTYNGSEWVAWTNLARNQQFDNTETTFEPAPGTTQKAIEKLKTLVDGKMPNPVGTPADANVIKWVLANNRWEAAKLFLENVGYDNTDTQFSPAPSNSQQAIEKLKTLVDTKANTTSLDATVATGTVNSSGSVSFTVTDTSLTYDLYVDIGTGLSIKPVTIDTITITSAATNNITYKLNNASSGMQCKLRKVNL